MAETGTDTGAASGGGELPHSQADVGALIAKHYVGLRLLITRRTGDQQVAADLLNDAVCTTWEKLRAGQIRRPDQIAGYVFQVAMNLLRNHRRVVAERPGRRASLDQLDELKGSAAPEQLEDRLAGRLKGMIQGLDSLRDRMILVRFYLDEEDKDSICRDMRLTSLQFDKVLHRARRRMRELLQAQGLSSTDFLLLSLL
jgi:RNA polymerase sigma-70 factor (ECF subfamily)